MRIPASSRLWLGLLLAAAACRATKPIVTSPPPQPFAALVVAPMELTFVGEPFEAALRTEDVLATLWTASRFPVLTPGEVTLRQGRTDVLHGSDVVLRAAALGVDPRRVALLTGRAALNEGKAQAVTSGAGRGASSIYQGEVVVSLALFDAEGRLVGEVSERRDLDPFAEHPSADPRPELRDAIQTATRALAEACEDCFAQAPRPLLALRTNPAVILTRAGARAALVAKPELERDQEMLPVMYYFDPELPLREAQRLFTAVQSGFCLLGNAPPALHAGDCVSAADGVPLDGPHPLARALARSGTVKLTVFAAGASEAHEVLYGQPGEKHGAAAPSGGRRGAGAQTAERRQ